MHETSGEDGMRGDAGQRASRSMTSSGYLEAKTKLD
jgi:hypothetical protein